MRVQGENIEEPLVFQGSGGEGIQITRPMEGKRAVPDYPPNGGYKDCLGGHTPVSTVCQLQDTRYKIQDTGYKIQDTCRIQDTGIKEYIMQDSRNASQPSGPRGPADMYNPPKGCKTLGKGVKFACRRVVTPCALGRVSKMALSLNVWLLNFALAQARCTSMF